MYKLITSFFALSKPDTLKLGFIGMIVTISFLKKINYLPQQKTFFNTMLNRVLSNDFKAKLPLGGKINWYIHP